MPTPRASVYPAPSGAIVAGGWFLEPEPSTEPYIAITRPWNMGAAVCFKALHQTSRYERWQRALVLDGTASATHQVGVHGFNFVSGGETRPLSQSAYTLLIDGVPRTTVSGLPAGTREFNFTLDVTALSEGWHTMDMQATGLNVVGPDGRISGEMSPPFPVYIRKSVGAPDPAMMPVWSAVFERVFLGGFDPTSNAGWGNFHLGWVPAVFDPVVVPLTPRTFTHSSTPLAAKQMFREVLVPKRDYMNRRPNRTRDGILNTGNLQNYFDYDMFEALPRTNLLDGPRGHGSLGFCTHLAIANAAPDGVVRRTTYFCDPWRFGKIKEDGTIVTLAGYRHKGVGHHLFETPTVRYPASESDPEGSLQLIGNWDAVPADRRGFHELWGMAWDERTLTIDESVRIPEENNEHPHIVGPVAFLTDTKNNRIIKLQFAPADRREPIVTEFITGLSDPWDIVYHDGSIYVTERAAHRISEFDATTGAFIRAVVQGANLGYVAATRKAVLNPGVTVAQARAQPICLPEGLYYQDGSLYWASLATSQVKSIYLDTGEIGVAADLVNGSGGTQMWAKLAIGDGTIGPRGMIFVSTWIATYSGYPFVALHNGSPNDWSETPPAVTAQPLWYTSAEKTPSRALKGNWATPVQLEGGITTAEYSVDGAAGWHSVFAAGDQFMRLSVSGGPFGAAIRIVGEKDAAPVGSNYTDHIFRRSATAPATPASNGGGQYFMFAPTSSSTPRGNMGNQPEYTGQGNYSAAVAVGHGRIVCAAGTDGVSEWSFVKAGDVAYNHTKMNQQYVAWISDGSHLLYGDGAWGYYGSPLPWGQSADRDLFMRAHGHTPP